MISGCDLTNEAVDRADFDLALRSDSPLGEDVASGMGMGEDKNAVFGSGGDGRVDIQG